MNPAGTASPASAEAQTQLRGARVLVVEDDQTSRRVLELQLKMIGVEPEVAVDGLNALSLLAEKGPHAFDAIVTDFNMPGMDGTQLLQKLREIDDSLAAIMLTATDARNVVVDSLRVGVVDFLEKPCDRNRLYNAITRAVAQTRQQRSFRTTESEVESLKTLTPVLSHRNLPSPVAHEWDYAEANLPIRQAGGDFTMHLEMDATHSLVLVGDVSGHDLRAAYIGAYFQGLARGLAEQGVPITQVLQRFNRILIEEFNLGACPLSLSVAAVSFDWEKGCGEVVTAGLPLTVHVGLDGRVSSLGAFSYALGWFDDWEPEITKFELNQTRGLYLWSDGLEDFAFMKGVDPLTAANRLLAESDSAKRLAIATDRTDDVLALRLYPTNTPTALPFFSNRYTQADLDLIDDHQAKWERCFAFSFPDIPEDRRLDWLLVVREALLNGLTHGCSGQRDGECVVRFVAEIQPALLRLFIEDSGPGYLFKERNTQPDHESLGLKLIKAVADKCITTRNGASLEIQFNIYS